MTAHSPVLGPADEAFHPAGEEPHWNESAWFGFCVPERDLNGFFYFFHDVRTGTSGGGPALWDPSGEQVYLRHEVLDPMRSYWLSYAELGLELDVTWTALSTG